MREARGLFSLHSPSLISAGTVRQRMLVTTRVTRESVSAPRSELSRRTGGGVRTRNALVRRVRVVKTPSKMTSGRQPVRSRFIFHVDIPRCAPPRLPRSSSSSSADRWCDLFHRLSPQLPMCPRLYRSLTRPCPRLLAVLRRSGGYCALFLGILLSILGDTAVFALMQAPEGDFYDAAGCKTVGGKYMLEITCVSQARNVDKVVV